MRDFFQKTWIASLFLLSGVHSLEAKECRELLMEAYSIPGYFLTHIDIENSSLLSHIHADGVCGQVCMINALTLVEMIVDTAPVAKRLQIVRMNGLLTLLARNHNRLTTHGTSPEIMLRFFTGWQSPLKEKLRLTYYPGFPIITHIDGVPQSQIPQRTGVANILKYIEPDDFRKSDADFFLIGLSDARGMYGKHFTIGTYDSARDQVKILDPNYPRGSYYAFGKPDPQIPGRLILEPTELENGYSPKSVIEGMIGVQFDLPKLHTANIKALQEHLKATVRPPSARIRESLGELARHASPDNPFFQAGPLNNTFGGFERWVIEYRGSGRIYEEGERRIAQEELNALKIKVKGIWTRATLMEDGTYRFRNVPGRVEAKYIDELLVFVDAL